MTERRERGAVTAETAVALPALVLVLALCLGGVATGVAEVRCVDAARAAARALARGDEPSRAVALARAAAPSGAVVTIRRTGDTVTVTVSARVALVPVGGRRLAIPVDASASAVVEPGVDGPGG
jgi:hypothetical protein